MFNCFDIFKYCILYLIKILEHNLSYKKLYCLRFLE